MIVTTGYDVVMQAVPICVLGIDVLR